MALSYHIGQRGVLGTLVYLLGGDGVNRGGVIPAMTLDDGTGANAPLGSASNPLTTAGAMAPLPATTDRSGTATTTSGGLNVPANSARKFLVGQNISAVNIGFNEQGGTAAIGTAGTYTVPAGQSFSISSNKLINFIAASGTAAVSMTEG